MRNYDEELNLLIKKHQKAVKEQAESSVYEKVHEDAAKLIDDMTNAKEYRMIVYMDPGEFKVMPFSSLKDANDYIIAMMKAKKAEWTEELGSNAKIEIRADREYFCIDCTNCEHYMEFYKLFHADSGEALEARKTPKYVIKDGEIWLDLWTVQDRKAYDSMMETGVLTAPNDRSLLFPGKTEKKQNREWNAYDWIVEEMNRFEPEKQPKNVKYPVWGWYKHNGLYGRPDGAIVSASFKGRKSVAIHFEAPLSQALLSDYAMWHGPLNNSVYLCLPDNLTDDEQYDLMDRVNDSLDRNPKAKKRAWEMTVLVNDHGTKNLYNVQACLWQIRKEWVKDVEFLDDEGAAYECLLKA